jgi:hypothetical protein
MTVRDIVKKYLEDNGYDGLAINECGCGLGDLMPCDNASPYCVPAKRFKCNRADCPTPGFCAGDVDDWCYRPVEN